MTKPHSAKMCQMIFQRVSDGRNDFQFMIVPHGLGVHTRRFRHDCERVIGFAIPTGAPNMRRPFRTRVHLPWPQPGTSCRVGINRPAGTISISRYQRFEISRFNIRVDVCIYQPKWENGIGPPGSIYH